MCLHKYFQMVDRLDEGVMSPDLGPLNYKSLYKAMNDGGLLLSFPFAFLVLNYKYMQLCC